MTLLVYFIIWEKPQYFQNLTTLLFRPQNFTFKSTKWHLHMMLFVINFNFVVGCISIDRDLLHIFHVYVCMNEFFSDRFKNKQENQSHSVVQKLYQKIKIIHCRMNRKMFYFGSSYAIMWSSTNICLYICYNNIHER